MSSSSLYDQRKQFYLAVSPTMRGGLIFCILMGAVAFIGGMVAGEATRTWGSFLFNLFFFFAISVGGIAFAGMQDVIGAKWGRPMMRLHESFASFLPLAALCFVIFLFCIKLNILGAGKVYSWIADPDVIHGFWGKEDWLVPEFMIVRDIVALGLILYFAFWQLGQKVRRDHVMVASESGPSQAREQGLRLQAKLRYWSAPVLVVYAICFSLLAFDLTMSLAPTWYSTLWGGWSFAAMMQTTMASILIFMFVMKDSPVGHLLRQQNFHDVGKLMHGFTIFFAYLTYAHIITYWYGNVPEETEYFLHRLHDPWVKIVIAIPFLVFLLPLFALIPKVSKWTAAITLPICGVILFSQWLVSMLVVIPQVVDGKTWGLPWIEVGLFLGFLGGFLSTILWFGKRFPMVGVGDPLLAEALAHSNH
jgi:hypothetical protein